MAKITKILKNFIKYLKKGGVTYCNIYELNQGSILNNKTVLIIGGTTGIGYAIAKKCLSQGAKVIITGRNIKNLKDAKSTLDNKNLYTLVWDIKDVSIGKAKIQEAVELVSGTINCLVNNAGIYMNEEFGNITEESYDAIMDTNLKGIFFSTQEFVNYLLENKLEGNIVITDSNRAIFSDDRTYGISKWGIKCFIKGLAKDVIRKGIRVNGIAPGVTISNINKIDPKDNIYSEGVYNKRILLPQEIAETALFLLSDTSKAVVGQIIVCDDGDSLH